MPLVYVPYGIRLYDFGSDVFDKCVSVVVCDEDTCDCDEGTENDCGMRIICVTTISVYPIFFLNIGYASTYGTSLSTSLG